MTATAHPENDLAGQKLASGFFDSVPRTRAPESLAQLTETHQENSVTVVTMVLGCAVAPNNAGTRFELAAFGRSEVDRNLTMKGDLESIGEEILTALKRDVYYDGNMLVVRKPWWKGGGVDVYFISPRGAERIIGERRLSEAMLAAGLALIIVDPSRGRYDDKHDRYDKAREAAFRKAGDLGPDTAKEYDPKTGTLVGEQSSDGKRGWRDDGGHFNWWDWTEGKKGTGGKYGHEYYPPEQAGPHSPPPSQKP